VRSACRGGDTPHPRFAHLLPSAEWRRLLQLTAFSPL
jgi:hypothetical protein